MPVGFVFDLLAGMGRSRTTLPLQACWLAALVPALVVGAHLGGIRGVAIAHVLVATLVAIPPFLATLHRARIDLPAVGRRLARPALGVLAVVAVGALAQIALPNPFAPLLAFAPCCWPPTPSWPCPPHDLRVSGPARGPPRCHLMPLDPARLSRLGPAPRCGAGAARSPVRAAWRRRVLARGVDDTAARAGGAAWSWPPIPTTRRSAAGPPSPASGRPAPTCGWWW